MSGFMSRLQRWLSDPFGKEQIRRHTHVIEAMHETKIRTQVTRDKLAETAEPRFPVGHMIGSAHSKRAERVKRRS